MLTGDIETDADCDGELSGQKTYDIEDICFICERSLHISYTSQ